MGRLHVVTVTTSSTIKRGKIQTQHSLLWKSKALHQQLPPHPRSFSATSLDAESDTQLSIPRPSQSPLNSMALFRQTPRNRPSLTIKLHPHLGRGWTTVHQEEEKPKPQ